jgi:hypothetical protein
MNLQLRRRINYPLLTFIFDVRVANTQKMNLVCILGSKFKQTESSNFLPMKHIPDCEIEAQVSKRKGNLL